MGIRLALGAESSHVGGLVLRQGLGMVALGISVGLAGAWSAARVVNGLLFGVEMRDPVTFLTVTGVVLGVSALAFIFPVLRAIHSDPREALQSE